MEMAGGIWKKEDCIQKNIWMALKLLPLKPHEIILVSEGAVLRGIPSINSGGWM